MQAQTAAGKRSEGTPNAPPCPAEASSKLTPSRRRRTQKRRTGLRHRRPSRWRGRSREPGAAEGECEQRLGSMQKEMPCNCICGRSSKHRLRPPCYTLPGSTAARAATTLTDQAAHPTWNTAAKAAITRMTSWAAGGGSRNSRKPRNTCTRGGGQGAGGEMSL